MNKEMRVNQNKVQQNLLRKYFVNYAFMLLIVTLYLITSCSKNDDLPLIEDEIVIDNPPNDNVPPIYDTIPIDTSSININLMLPQDWVILNNSFIGSSSNATATALKKISGPMNYYVDSSNSEYTVIYGLVKGNYQFELTVNYANGSFSKVTANVNLYDVSIIPESAKEIVIENVRWTFPWYPTLEIADFYKKIIAESQFRIFVKRDSSINWENVPAITYEGSLTNTYEYFIERRLPAGAGMYANGSLFIFYYGTNTLDTPDVKIVFW